jgi:ADP-ribose pyrophosphatase
METPRIVNEKTILNNHLVVVQAELEQRTASGKKTSFRRERVDRQGAAVVFIYNTDSKTVVLTRQYRYPIVWKTAEPILEIVAGKMDPGERPEETAIRESLEESGYKIQAENIRHIHSFFASPGYTSEIFHLFYATVTKADRKTKGGGNEDENEFIEVVEIPYHEFIAMLDSGKIADAKTLVAGLYVKLSGNFGD